MERMKIETAAFLCVWLFAAMISGCSAQQPAAKAGVWNPFTEPQYDWTKGTGESLTVWGIYPDLERSYIRKAFTRFEELTSDSLEVVQIAQEEFEGRMAAAVNGEIAAPDIVFSYGGTNIESFYPDENFYDFSNEVWVNDLTDTSVNQTIYNGKVIGLPLWEASISGTVYNKRLFDRLHIEIPQTQEEFMEVCEKLLSNGVIPMYLPGKEISMLLYQFAMDSILEQDGILEALNEGKIGYADIPEMETVVSWYKTMAGKGYFGDTWQTNDWDGMNDAMMSGRYAMMLCWDTWLYTDFSGNPQHFGLMPAFLGVPQTGTFEGPNLGMFLVNKNGARVDAALNFITFLADPYNYNVIFEGLYTAPVFKNQIASISTPQYLEAERLVEQNFRDSTAWLRMRGFSQMDASCILEFMEPGSTQTPRECLRKMDTLRNGRLKLQKGA